MDFRIHHDKLELDGTNYIEIGPGKYSGRHWQPGFVFIYEGAFDYAEGILQKHYPEYDHYGMNDIGKTVGLEVLREWRDVSRRLSGLDPTETARALRLPDSWLDSLGKERGRFFKDLAAMLAGLAETFEAFYEKEEWVCVLGI